jgi:hypothetical protein
MLAGAGRWSLYGALMVTDAVIRVALAVAAFLLGWGLTGFLWATVGVILRDLFRRSVPGVQPVLGAICAYLIAADAWSGINLLAYQLVPASYSINPEIDLLLGHWHSRLSVFSYYSFSQMLGHHASARAGNDLEPAQRHVRHVLHRHRRIAFRRHGAKPKGQCANALSAGAAR